MKLVSPVNDWKNALDLNKATPQEVALFLAKQHNWVVNEQDGKIYCGPHNRAAAAKPPIINKNLIRLVVQYYSQRDSQVSGQWWRSCFSSAVAMLVESVKPNVLSDSKNADDEHLLRVFQYGDTTDPVAQIKALAHYGIKAKRRTDLGWSDIDKQLARGIPVPIGILIHGHVSRPTGDGHWITVIGQTTNGYLVHDPYGELDLVTGKYLHADGQARSYSRQNLGPRWMVDGTGGWAIIVD